MFDKLRIEYDCKFIKNQKMKIVGKTVPNINFDTAHYYSIFNLFSTVFVAAIEDVLIVTQS